MNTNNIWTVLFLYAVLNSCSAFSGEEIIDPRAARMGEDLNSKQKSNKISSQLELALEILTDDINRAYNIADSSLTAAKITNSKNLELQAYYTLGRINDLQDNKDLSVAYYDTALTVSDATGDNWYKGEILFRLGAIKRNMGEELHALEYFNASIQACRLSDNFRIMGSSYSMMGTIFRVNGLYDRAIEYIINSKLNYEKAGFTEGDAWAAYILGRIYADLKLPQKALGYFEEALGTYIKMASVNGDENGVAICYEQIGLLKSASGNFKEANNYIDSTLRIYTTNNSVYGISNSHKNLGIVAYSMGNYELAEKYLNKSLEVKKNIDDVLSMPTLYEYLGLCKIARGQNEEGFKNLRHGLALAISNKQKRIELNIYSELTKAYLKVNDLKNAVECQNKQIELQDLILSGAANIKIEQLQRIYEIDKQNIQIAELEKQNEINALKIRQHRFFLQILFIGIFLALIFSITIMWFYNHIRHKNIQLKETNAAKDKFFAIIAHDLRGPTGNLTSFLEHLNETFNELNKDELRKLLITLYESAKNVGILLENLLSWAKSQLNKIEYSPAELELTDVIQASIKGLKQAADSKQIDIRYELDDQIIVVADLNMAQTIIRNIISNSIKFTHRGGSIMIKSAIKDIKYALISVTDNGVGIEKNTLSKIFDITNTFHTRGTENEKSTGLGLILVKDFIDKNNGTISITSQKDKGTIVTFTLPLFKKNEHPDHN